MPREKKSRSPRRLRQKEANDAMLGAVYYRDGTRQLLKALKAGANVHYSNDLALNTAARYGKGDQVLMLLRHGADPRALDNLCSHGLLEINAYRERNNGEPASAEDITRWLLHHGHGNRNFVKVMFVLAIHTRQWDLVREILRGGMDFKEHWISDLRDNAMRDPNTPRDIAALLMRTLVQDPPETPLQEDWRSWRANMSDEQRQQHADLSQRRRQAKGKRTPPERLMQLARDQNEWVRVAVAQRPDLPAPVALLLATDGDPLVTNTLAENPATTTETLAAIVDGNPVTQTLISVASNPKTDAVTLERIVDQVQQHGYALAHVTRNPNVTPELLARIATLPKTSTVLRQTLIKDPRLPREAVAQAMRMLLPTTPHEAVESLLNEDDPMQEAEENEGDYPGHRSYLEAAQLARDPTTRPLGKNPSTPPEILRKLADELPRPGKSPLWVWYLKNPSVPSEGLQRAAERFLALTPEQRQREEVVQRLLLRHPNLPQTTKAALVRAGVPDDPVQEARTPEAQHEHDMQYAEGMQSRSPQRLSYLAGSVYDDVRTAVASNAYTPPEALLRLARDPLHYARQQAAANPHLPPEAYAALAADDMAAGFLIHNPKVPGNILRQVAERHYPDLDPAFGMVRELAAHPNCPRDIAARIMRGMVPESVAPVQEANQYAHLRLIPANDAIVKITQTPGGLPPDALRMLATHPSSWVVYNVARSRYTPPDVLENLLVDSDVDMAYHLAANPGASPDFLRKVHAERGHALVVAEELTTNPHTPADVLEHLAQEYDYAMPEDTVALDLLAAIAKHPNAPRRLAAQLMRRLIPESVEADLYANIPANEVALLIIKAEQWKGLPPATYRALAAHPSKVVRQNVAASQFAPLDVLKTLWKEADADMAWALAKNPNAPPDFLRHLFQSHGLHALMVDETFATNPNTPPDVIERLAEWYGSEDQPRTSHVIRSLLKHPNTPRLVAAQLVRRQVPESVTAAVAALVEDTLPPDPEDIEDMAADFVEQQVGRYQFPKNWRRDRGRYLDLLKAMPHGDAVLAAVDRLAAENATWDDLRRTHTIELNKKAKR